MWQYTGALETSGVIQTTAAAKAHCLALLQKNWRSQETPEAGLSGMSSLSVGAGDLLGQGGVAVKRERKPSF